MLTLSKSAELVLAFRAGVLPLALSKRGIDCEGDGIIWKGQNKNIVNEFYNKGNKTHNFKLK